MSPQVVSIRHLCPPSSGAMSDQSEFRLGVVGVVEGGRYPSFPGRPIARIRWAMDAPIKRTTDKAVLIILSVHTSDEGVAWPAMRTIARCSSIQRRAAIYLTSALMGQIEVISYQQPSRLMVPPPARG